jgi:hypothetical protein
VATIGAGSSVGPFSLTVSIPAGKAAAQLQSIGWVGFRSPVAGDAVSGWIGGA